MNNALLISSNDDVVVAIEDIKGGDIIKYIDRNGIQNSFSAIEDIIIYHKIARNEIKKDDHVIKYGEHIGVALETIKPGMHVHVHNVIGVREEL